MITPPEWQRLRDTCAAYLGGRASTAELDAALDEVMEREALVQRCFAKGIVTTVSWDCLGNDELRQQLEYAVLR